MAEVGQKVEGGSGGVSGERVEVGGWGQTLPAIPTFCQSPPTGL